jgi:hypothetical protein
MTFTELLPAIQRLRAFEKLRLIRILAEELDTEEDIYPLQSHKVYYLPTPYHSCGAGRVLMAAMKVAETQGD